MNAFTHRKKCQQLWRYFKNDVEFLTEQMNAVILNKQVGQASLLSESIQSVKTSIKNATTCELNAIEKEVMNRKRKHEETLSTNESTKAQSSTTNVQSMRKEKRRKPLDNQCVPATIRQTRRIKEKKREKASKTQELKRLPEGSAEPRMGQRDYTRQKQMQHLSGRTNKGSKPWTGHSQRPTLSTSKKKGLVTRTQRDRHLRSSRDLTVCDAAKEEDATST